MNLFQKSFITVTVLNLLIFVFSTNIFADISGEWTLLQPEGHVPPGRTGHTGIYRYPSNEMVIFGGFKGMQYPTYEKDIYKLNLDTNVWEQLPLAPTDRAYHSAIYDPIEDRMLVFG